MNYDEFFEACVKIAGQGVRIKRVGYNADNKSVFVMLIVDEEEDTRAEIPGIQLSSMEIVKARIVEVVNKARARRMSRIAFQKGQNALFDVALMKISQ